MYRVTVKCKHMRFKSFDEFCAVNSCAISLLLINLLYVGCSCVLNMIFVFILRTFNTKKG